MDMIVSKNNSAEPDLVMPCGNNNACLRFDQCFCNGINCFCFGTYN